jgi:hypothetical protein
MHIEPYEDGDPFGSGSTWSALGSALLTLPPEGTLMHTSIHPSGKGHPRSHSGGGTSREDLIMICIGLPPLRLSTVHFPLVYPQR